MMLDTSKRRITLLLIFLFKPLDILIFYDLKYTVVVIGGEINLFLFKCRKVISSLCNNTLHDWLKKLGPFFHPIRVKLKPVVTRLHPFSRASRRLHLFRVLIGPMACLGPF